VLIRHTIAVSSREQVSGQEALRKNLENMSSFLPDCCSFRSAEADLS
jgi:hypothetical protein